MKTFLAAAAGSLLIFARHAAAFAPPPATKATTLPAPPSSRGGPSARTRLSPGSIRGSVAALPARPQTRFREVQGNILTRRTINDFDPSLPSNWERSLERAIEAAIYAPNHKRTEPWRFYLLGPEAIEKVCRLNAEIVAEAKGEEAGEKKLKRWLQMPGWLVVTCARTDDDDAAGDMLDPMSLAREDYAACCCAVQNLCLSLHSQGLGTKWTTGGVNFDPRFSEAVGFDPAAEYTVGTIWFGRAKSVPGPPGKKRGLEGVLTRVE